MDHVAAMQTTTWVAMAVALGSGALFVATVSGKTPVNGVLGQTGELKPLNLALAAFYGIVSLAGVVVTVQMLICRGLECC